MIKNFYVQEKVRSTFTRNELQPTGCNSVLKESCKSGLRGPGGPGGPLFALSETPPPRGGPHFSAPPSPPPLKHTFRQLFDNFSQLFVTFFKFSTTFSQNLSKIIKKSALFMSPQKMTPNPRDPHSGPPKTPKRGIPHSGNGQRYRVQKVIRIPETRVPVQPLRNQSIPGPPRKRVFDPIFLIKKSTIFLVKF